MRSACCPQILLCRRTRSDAGDQPRACPQAGLHVARRVAGHEQLDRDRCSRECPNVFGDPDSLMAFESLTCKDAVEYVDGTSHAIAR